MKHKFSKNSIGVLLTVYSLTVLSLSSFAEEKVPPSKDLDSHYGQAYALYVENDTRAIGGPGSDQAYTNGFKLSYIYAQDRIPKWSTPVVHRFEFLDQELEKSKVNYGLSLGQQIYTPNNTNRFDLAIDDRPYAGWLYLGFAVSLKRKQVEHFFELDLGMIGPSSMGQQAQNGFHELVHSSRAEGWTNELHDEPTVQLFYQKRYKAFQNENIDLIPYYGAAFGNVQIGGHVGGVIRTGVHLPDNFGPSRPSASDGNSFVSSSIGQPVSKPSGYFFGGLRGNALARNIFLDGNTLQSSHHVKKYPFTFETELGIGMQLPSFSVVWSFVTRSPEFEQRSMFSSFASLNFVYFL